MQLHDRKGKHGAPVTCGDWLFDNRLGLASGTRVKISKPVSHAPHPITFHPVTSRHIPPQPIPSHSIPSNPSHHIPSHFRPVASRHISFQPHHQHQLQPQHKLHLQPLTLDDPCLPVPGTREGSAVGILFQVQTIWDAIPRPPQVQGRRRAQAALLLAQIPSLCGRLHRRQLHARLRDVWPARQ